MITVSSASYSVSTQNDGRAYVTNNFLLTDGSTVTRVYLADAGTDYDNVLMSMNSAVSSDLISAECDNNYLSVQNLGSSASLTYNYTNSSINASFIRSMYQGLVHVDAIMVGDYLNTLSSIDLQNIFNMTASQISNLRISVLTPSSVTAAAIRTAQGQ